jgi:hypothetical protein
MRHYFTLQFKAEFLEFFIFQMPDTGAGIKVTGMKSEATATQAMLI